MNNIRQIRNIIYRAKQQYGCKMTLRLREVTGVDLLNGTETSIDHDYVIRKAVLLPRNISRDSSPIASNKNYNNFTYGGYYDPSMRQVILDAKDIKTLLQEQGEITPNWSAAIGGQVYNVKEAEPYGDAEIVAYRLILSTIEGQ